MKRKILQLILAFSAVGATMSLPAMPVMASTMASAVPEVSAEPEAGESVAEANAEDDIGIPEEGISEESTEVDVLADNSTEDVTSDGLADDIEPEASDESDVTADEENADTEDESSEASAESKKEEKKKADKDKTEEKDNTSIASRLTLKGLMIQLATAVLLFVIPGCYIYWKSKR